MKNRNKALGLILLAIMAGCSSSKTVPYESKWNAPFSYVDEIKPDQQDQKSRLKYGIINDDKYLFLTFKTKDPATIQKIVRNGLRVSFTPEKQKGGAYSLLFPVIMKEDRKALKNLQMDMPNSLGLQLLLDSYNKEAIWKDKQGQHSINLVAGEGSIKANISIDQNGELTEQISIPLNLMAVDIQEVSAMGIDVKVDGINSRSGFSPSIGIGGGFGMGGGMGMSIGTGGYGSRYGNEDRGVDLKLQVKLARQDFQQ